MGLPQILCRGLGNEDFIRVPSPAARTTAIKGLEVFNTKYPSRIRRLFLIDKIHKIVGYLDNSFRPTLT
jgi:hypothetical protein